MNLQVAVESDGSFIVTWSSENGDWNFKVYARLFDKNGNALGSEIFVSEPDFISSSIRSGKSIAVDEKGNYCVTWSSHTGSFSSIYLQLINSSGQKIGQNILVSSLTDSSSKYFPEITSTYNGYFFIIWEEDDEYPLGGGLSARIYHSDGYFVTGNFLIYNSSSSWNPCTISSDKDSTFFVFWLGNGNQYLRKINLNGEFVSDTVRVRYNSLNQMYSYRGGFTDVINNHFFIAPEFYDRIDRNIYLQKFNINLQPVGPFTSIHDDNGSANQKKSLVKFNNRGESIILWEDKRNGRYDLFAQVYDKDFNPLGNNLQINETNGEYWGLFDKKVEDLSDGTFVIAFSGSEAYDGTDIFLQLVNSSGEKIGNNKLVKERYYYYDYNVTLKVNSKDEIFICWYNQYDAYLRK